MRDISLTLPELCLARRHAGGGSASGLAFWWPDRLPESQRKAVGWTLLLGCVLTVPLAFENMIGKAHASTPVGLSPGGV